MNQKNQNRRTRTTSTMHRALFAALLTQAAGGAIALGQSEAPATNNVTVPSQPRVPETRPLPADNAAPASPTTPVGSDDGAGTSENTATTGGNGGGVSTDKVKVDENNIVDLHVNDEELANVLEMLSIQSQKNIVASKAVSARVTANLYGVTFFEALDAILNVNGFGYIQQGNFIYVYTQAELEVIAKAQRQKVSKVINLNYLNAIDAAEFVKPLLSEAGQIKTNGKTAVFPTPGAVPLGNDEYAGNATLVVIDFEDHVAEVENLIKQLDTRPAQVLVEATILQTTLTEANAFGVDFSIIADMNFTDFIGGPTSAVNSLIRGSGTPGGSTPLPADGGGSAVSSTVGNTAGPGGLKVGVVSNDVAVFLRVLDEVTDTTILSNPKILALNRQPSRVLVGRKVGYLSTTSTDTATTQTVEFLDTGTQLNFRPFVTNEGMVRMELKPQVSEAVIRDTNDSAGKTVTIPDEITNELVTNVIVGDGQTVVLGGLFREATNSARRQIPFLGDIPVVGQAFRGNDDSTNRNEIIFLVTPTIVNDTMMSEAGARGKDYIDHVRAGSREGLLYWSREKLTSKMNVEAERLAQAGDTEKAIWKVNRSLSLNPRQPEAVALRERLTGEKSQWPDRSFLERVLHGDAKKMSEIRRVENAESPDMPEGAKTTPASNEREDEAVLEQAAAPQAPKTTDCMSEPATKEMASGTATPTVAPSTSDVVTNTPANASNTFNPAPALEPAKTEPTDVEPAKADEGFEGSNENGEMSDEGGTENVTPANESAGTSPMNSSPGQGSTSQSTQGSETAPMNSEESGDSSELFDETNPTEPRMPEGDEGASKGMGSSSTLNRTTVNVADTTLPAPCGVGMASNTIGNAPVNSQNPAQNVANSTQTAVPTAMGTEFARLWLGRSGLLGGSWAFFREFGFSNSSSGVFTEVQELPENAEGK
ncbi:MAG TPA: hypothetical protein VD997_08090 [Phycisphaerales bacterium]|nr:hypothetical protein [Phycisphaerales bacterium]